MGLAQTIHRRDGLWRAAYSSRVVGGVQQRSVIRVKSAFMGPIAKWCRSTDRLDGVDLRTMVPRFELEAARRPDCRGFYGWLVVTAGCIEDANCKAVASPKPDNPYHADIFFPAAHDKGSREAMKQCALDLARCSGWMDRPPQDSE